MPNVFSALSGIFSLRDILWGMDLDRASANGMGHVADEPISKLCLNGRVVEEEQDVCEE